MTQLQPITPAQLGFPEAITPAAPARFWLLIREDGRFEAHEAAVERAASSRYRARLCSQPAVVHECEFYSDSPVGAMELLAASVFAVEVCPYGSLFRHEFQQVCEELRARAADAERNLDRVRAERDKLIRAAETPTTAAAPKRRSPR